MNHNLNKVILVTGGSDGFGKTLAARLAASHRVIILAPNKQKLILTAKEIGCDYAIADVADPKQVQRAVKKIIAKYKKIDCLVNNAGIWIEGPLEKNDPALIRKAIEVNTIGSIYCAQAVIPAMKKQKNGLIVNLISQAGFYAKPNRAVYHASKWAITGLTKSLGLELEPFGIRVSGVYPGKMRTSLFKNAGIKKDMRDALDAGEVAKAVEFILNLDAKTVVPEIGIKYIGQ